MQAQCSQSCPPVHSRWQRLIPPLLIMCLSMLLLLVLMGNASRPAGAAPVQPAALSAPAAGCAPSWNYSVTSSSGPRGIAYDPARNRIYIANYDGPQGGNLLMVFFGYRYYFAMIYNGMTVTMTANNAGNSQAALAPIQATGAFTYMTKVITGMPEAQGVAFDGNRNRIYVVGGDRLYVVDGASFTLLHNIWLGNDDRTFAVAYNPTADKIYISHFDQADKITIIKAANPADPSSKTTIGHSVAHPIADPAFIAVNPATNKVYFANHVSPSGWVSVIDGTTDQITTEIYVGGDLYGITVDSVHNRVYASSISAAKVFAINGATDTALTPDSVQIVRAGTKPIPLRMIGVNPTVGSNTHVWLTTSADDWLNPANGENLLILLSFDPTNWPTVTAPVAMPIGRWPEFGLVVDPTTWNVFVSSTGADDVTSSQDMTTLCPTPLSPAMEDERLYVVVP